MEKELAVGYGDVTKRFARHIDDPYNHNIFFSGRYGIGKSTFLRKYFENNKKKYFPIFLSPVNYVVSSNENIFELIKVDIIKRLYEANELNFKKELSKGDVKEALKWGAKTTLKLAEKIAPLLTKLHPLAEELGKGAKKVYDLIADIEEFEAEFQKAPNDDNSKKLAKKAKQFSAQAGTYLEFDLISRLLYQRIQELNSVYTGGTVLVIDDLDRLDPEHIFRILNVFSAHHNDSDERHKFGFIKVIIVAHLNNIERTFYHRYGAAVEFDGYIDKFFSKEVFHFSNEDGLDVYLNEKMIVPLPDDENILFRELVKSFVNAGKLKIRNINKVDRLIAPDSFIAHRAKCPSRVKKETRMTFSEAEDFFISSDSTQIFFVIRYLATLFGGWNNFHSALISIDGGLIERSKIIPITRTMAIAKLILSTEGSSPLIPYFNVTKTPDASSFYGIYPNKFAVCELESNDQIVVKHVWTGKNKYSSNVNFYDGVELDVHIKDPSTLLYAHFKPYWNDFVKIVDFAMKKFSRELELKSIISY